MSSNGLPLTKKDQLQSPLSTLKCIMIALLASCFFFYSNKPHLPSWDSQRCHELNQDSFKC